MPVKSSKTSKQIVKNTALVFFGVVVGLAIAEGAARIIYTKPWYLRMLEEQTAHLQEGSIKINSLGLRGRDYPFPKPPNSKRVLMLGDSFTYGFGVSDDGAIFPSLLEKQLNAEFAQQGILIEILNGGMPGSLTDDWVDLLLRIKDSSELDVVLMVFFLRNGSRTGSMGAFFGPIRQELENRHQQMWLYQYSYIFRLYQDARDRAYLSDKYSKALNDSYFGGPGETEEWEIAKANILRIQGIAQEMDAKVGLVVFPVLVELNENYPFKAVCEVIAEYSRENDIPTHSLLPAFMGQDGPSLWVSSYDQHPNRVAHQIAADSMLPFLKQLLKDGLHQPKE